MVLGLIVSDKYVLLPDNFSLRLSFKFPLPYMDTIPAATSYWFTVPAIKENNLIFKHANFIPGTNKIKIYDCVLVVAGSQIKGKLYVRSAKTAEYKCFVVLNDIIESISGQKIADIVTDTHYLGDDTDAIIAEAKSLSSQSYPDSGYAFPVVYNEKYYSDKNQDYLDYGKRMNQYSMPTESYVKNYYFEGRVYNVNPLVAMPYMLKIIDDIFKSIQFSVIGSAHQSPDFGKMVCYNNVALERSNAKDYLFAKHPEPLSNFEGGVWQINTQIWFSQIVIDADNTYQTLQGAYHSDIGGAYRISFRCEAKKSYQSLPQYLYLRILVGSSYIEAGYHELETIDDYQYIEFSTIINFEAPVNLTFFLGVLSNYHRIETKNIELEIYPAEEHLMDKFSKQIELKNHVPDLTVSGFLNALIKKFSWAVFFSFENMQVEIESWNNILSNQNYIDLTNYVIAKSENITFEEKEFSFLTEWKDDEMLEDNLKDTGSYENMIIATTEPFPDPVSVNQLLLVKPANYFNIAVNDDTGSLKWEFLTDNFADIITEGKDVQEIKTEINTLFSRLNLLEGQLPTIEQIGTISETGVNPSGFKLLNYHGLGTYPFASNNKYDKDGNPTTGVNLHTQGEDGLYETFAKDFYDYVATHDLVEMDFKINADIFNKLVTIFKAGSKSRKIRVGSRNYIPETVDISLGLGGFQNCKIKLR